MGARSAKKVEEALLDIKGEIPSAEIVFLDIDLASFASTKRAAETYLSTNDRLDILINNAGIFAAPPGLTEGGYEVQFGTNYIGSALLTRLLLPILTKTADTGLQGSGRSRGGWTSVVTGGKAAVSGLTSGHFRRQSHRSLYSSCNVQLVSNDE